MFSVIKASWTLFFGLALIMIGNGVQLVLLGVRASEAGFTNLVSGLVMGGYFLGLFIGSLIVPQFLSRVGHIRVFGALASIASAAVLLHIILINPLLWGLTRILSGFAYAGMYIVVESWLNDSATNKTRGQILSLYLIITMGGMGIGQMLAGLDDGQSATLFLVASVAVSVAVVPILITVGKAPDFSVTEATSLRRLFQISPLAFVGMALQGVVAAMMFGMGSVYGTRIGLTPPQVALFMVSVTVGSLVLQYPVGRLSDVIDRRVVILIVTMVSGVFASAGLFFGASQFWILLTIMGLYGGLSLTLYSLCIAHANDFLSPAQMVGTASALIMVNGAGSVIGSPLVALAMDVVGDYGYYGIIASTHFILGIFVLLRMTRRESVPNEAQGPFVAVPDAGTAVGITLNPETAWIEDDANMAEDDPLADNPYIPANFGSKDQS
ncbi:MAG: MFS transporter [Candidatus Puniceispirillaceae bacterium]